MDVCVRERDILLSGQKREGWRENRGNNTDDCGRGLVS